MDWCTPQKTFDELNDEFNFTLDPAATSESAKCAKYYTPKNDGLINTWAGNTVFCNPPYGKEIGNWVKKAHDEHYKHGATIVMLMPARTDTKYFHKYIYKKAEIRFLKGRLKFTDEQGNVAGSAPFPSMVVIWRKQEE